MAENLEIYEKLLELLASGRAIGKALHELGIPRLKWMTALANSPYLQDKFAAVQSLRAELLVDEAIEIADTEDNALKARNQIEIRRWYASRILSTKYGDRLDVNVSHNVDVRGALSEAKNRLRARDVSPPIIGVVQSLEKINPQINQTINNFDELL